MRKLTALLAATLSLAMPAYSALKPHYVGLASWYGLERQGRKMANGKRFDSRALTAASPSLPLGTVLRVRNLTNDNTVLVTVTDRGPNARLHRTLDLSHEAAAQLDYLRQGVTRVLLMPVLALVPEASDIADQLIEP